MIRTSIRLTAIALFGLTASIASAQRPDSGKAQSERRAVLEQRLRERMAQVVKQRVGLTDAQMTKLQATNRQFESQRVNLLTRERDLRRDLRQQIQSSNPDQKRVGDLLDQVMDLERQRLNIQQNEQRELAKFLTPVQRARLFGLQNDMRRRMQEMRARQARKGMPRN